MLYIIIYPNNKVVISKTKPQPPTEDNYYLVDGEQYILINNDAYCVKE